MTAPDADRSEDERFMRAALAYGRRGLGTTAPNPSVAALVVKDGAVLGRGVTAPGGRPHAEPVALARAGDASLGATLYVTLEPCSHHGRTGPCTDAVIAAGITRVVIGADDPDARVAGRGISKLREAGIAVVRGVCTEDAARDHVGHIRRAMDARPSVTLKLAETADGYAAGPPGAPRLLITGETADAWVHMSRANHDAVMVGAATARADDPLLTVRLPGLEGRSPARVVLDTRADLDVRSRLVASAAVVPLTVIVGPDADAAHVDALSSTGAEVVPVAGAVGGLDLGAALRAVATNGITRIFCEGGPRLGAALLDADLLDEVAILTGSDALGAPGLPAFDARARALLDTRFRPIEDRPVGRDRLRRYERTRRCSPA